MYQPRRPDVTPVKESSFHIVPFDEELRKAFKQEVKRQGRLMSEVMEEMVRDWLGQKVNMEDIVLDD